MTVRSRRNREHREHIAGLQDLYAVLEVEKQQAKLEIAARRAAAVWFWQSQRRPACVPDPGGVIGQPGQGSPSPHDVHFRGDPLARPVNKTSVVDGSASVRHQCDPWAQHGGPQCH